MYYTYILKSIKTNKLYIGQTENLERRLNEHNSNQSKSTKGKGPWEIIFAKGFESRSEAVKHELKLKSIKNNKYIINNLENIQVLRVPTGREGRWFESFIPTKKAVNRPLLSYIEVVPIHRDHPVNGLH